jgi:hypothetical protein
LLPDPPLDFDESIAVLRQVHLGGFVSVSVFEDQRGFPTATLMGYLVRVEESSVGAMLILRERPDANAPVACAREQHAADTL